ncbi:TPA: hypothetical protein ACGOV8_001487 [Streptococcus suis]
MNQRTRYRYETKNLRECKDEYDLIFRLIKDSIRRKKEFDENLLLRPLTISSTVVAECYLYKIIYSEHADDSLRNSVFAATTFIDKWQKLIDYCIEKTYKVPYVNLERNNKTAYFRYTEIKNYIDSDLNELYSLRNKFAHGEVLYAFDNSRQNYNQTTTTSIRTLDLMKVIRLRKSFDEISKLILYIIESQKTFDRDFDRYFAKYAEIKENYGRPDSYNNFKKKLMSKPKKFQ